MKLINALETIYGHAEENICDCVENAGSEKMERWGKTGEAALPVVQDLIDCLSQDLGPSLAVVLDLASDRIKKDKSAVDLRALKEVYDFLILIS
jgi:hypothetical protein